MHGSLVFRLLSEPKRTDVCGSRGQSWNPGMDAHLDSTQGKKICLRNQSGPWLDQASQGGRGMSKQRLHDHSGRGGGCVSKGLL